MNATPDLKLDGNKPAEADGPSQQAVSLERGVSAAQLSEAAHEAARQLLDGNSSERWMQHRFDTLAAYERVARGRVVA